MMNGTKRNTSENSEIRIENCTALHGTAWGTMPMSQSNQVGATASNILWHAGGPTAFIFHRSDNITDVFMKLFTKRRIYRNTEEIISSTLKTAASNNDHNFKFNRIDLMAYIDWI